MKKRADPQVFRLSAVARATGFGESVLKGWARRGKIETTQPAGPRTLLFVSVAEVERFFSKRGLPVDWAILLDVADDD